MTSRLQSALLMGALLVLGGCGEPPPELRASIQISQALSEDVATVSVFVMGPKRTDGVFLTCTSLVPQDIEPTDSRVELLAQAQVSGSGKGQSFDLAGVPAGDSRVVYVSAENAAGVLVGNGCTQGIKIGGGETVDVTVTVAPVL